MNISDEMEQNYCCNKQYIWDTLGSNWFEAFLKIICTKKASKNNHYDIVFLSLILKDSLNVKLIWFILEKKEKNPIWLQWYFW